MWTGNRQTGKLRQLYLAAVLRQDVEYFDTQTSTGVLLQVGGRSTCILTHILTHIHTCCYNDYVDAPATTTMPPA